MIIGKLIPAATGLKRYRAIEIGPTEQVAARAVRAGRRCSRRSRRSVRTAARSTSTTLGVRRRRLASGHGGEADGVARGRTRRSTTDPVDREIEVTVEAGPQGPASLVSSPRAVARPCRRPSRSQSASIGALERGRLRCRSRRSSATPAEAWSVPARLERPCRDRARDARPRAARRRARLDSGRITPNSSPPTRQAMSAERTTARSRRPTSASTASPREVADAVVDRLKSSRSRTISDEAPLVARARATSRSSDSWKQPAVVQARQRVEVGELPRLGEAARVVERRRRRARRAARAPSTASSGKPSRGERLNALSVPTRPAVGAERHDDAGAERSASRLLGLVEPVAVDDLDRPERSCSPASASSARSASVLGDADRRRACARRSAPTASSSAASTPGSAATASSVALDDLVGSSERGELGAPAERARELLGRRPRLAHRSRRAVRAGASTAVGDREPRRAEHSATRTSVGHRDHPP